MQLSRVHPLFWLLLTLALVALPRPAAAAESLAITRITPAGTDVPPGRQIVIQFNRSVVPIGRMDRAADEIPISITPALQCQWRWLNTSALACQLDEPHALKSAQQYTMEIAPGITAADGVTLARTYRYSFTTERPKIRHAWFRTWQAPGMPVIRIVLNQSVTGKSLSDHLYIVSRNGSEERLPLRVEPDPEDEEVPRYLPLPGTKLVLDTGEAQEARQSDDDPRQKDGLEARRVWLVRPQTELPLDTELSLRVEPGLVSALGPEHGEGNREVVRFHTFPDFAFLGVRCRNNQGQSILITGDNFRDPEMQCNPLSWVALAFSSPVLPEEIKGHVAVDPDLAGGRTDYDPWQNVSSSSSQLNHPYNKRYGYRVSLPERLRAADTYRLQIADPAAGPKDEFGRTLAAPLDFTFQTDHRVPNFELPHNTAVLEKAVPSEVPFYVTNLTTASLDYERLTPSRRDHGRHGLAIAKVDDVQYAVPLGVREVLAGESGAIFGRVHTTPPVRRKGTQAHLTFAQITPFEVHVKIGHYNTLVWVTDLATGKPVPDARVRLYRDTIASLSSAPGILKEGTTDTDGLLLLPGTAELDPELETFEWHWPDEETVRLFVRVDKGGDMALLPLAHRFEIRPGPVSGYSVHSRPRKLHGHIHAWGTTAQGIYRVGDTIQYKIYVRSQDNAGFVPAPLAGYQLEIIDPAGKTVHEEKGLTLSAFGGMNGAYTVPENGAVGWYRFQLSADFTKYTWEPMQVLVSDFTPAPFKVESELNGDLFGAGDTVTVTTRAHLHSGGPYGDAGLRVTATLNELSFSSRHPLAKGFWFNGSSYRTRRNLRLTQQQDFLDSQGRHEFAFPIAPEHVAYGRLTVESAVRDDRGKFVAASSSGKYVGLDRFVGLKNSSWLYDQDKPARVEYLVVDAHGDPAAGTAVAVTVERRERKAARVKGAGNAYLTQYVESWQTVAECQGESAAKPRECVFTPEKPGTYRITAVAKDTQGRAHTAQIYAWVRGKGRVVWHRPEDNSLKIIPEEQEYHIGDTARFLVENPFPGAKALVTIERYGVLRQWVETLDTATPVISFPVEPDFLPGFVLSVVVVSPRVSSLPPEKGQVDLGKPAQRLGYLQVVVKDPYKELAVAVKVERQVYKPRETVRVELAAKARQPGCAEPMEFAVAVLDEAVFDLLPKGRLHYDPYQGFYTLDGLDLRNFSLLTRLVGQQKFEKKGAAAAGDGGGGVSMRSLFKFVSYWNPALVADTNGRASFSFTAPDNLTGWRVLAIGVTPTDRMGLGEQTFKVNRPTEVRPVLPSQVTEGDSFRADFTVMNRTGAERELTVEIAAEGNLVEPVRHQEKLRLAPFKRGLVSLPIRTVTLPKVRGQEGEVRFTVTAGDRTDRDGLIHTLPVKKRRSFETAANYATFTGPRALESLLFPKGIEPDSGEVRVVASPTVLGNLAGAFRYLKEYPYTCWEQVLTRGVMAAHFKELGPYLPDDLAWPESATLPDRILRRAASYQAPNGGMVYFVPRDEFVSPYLSAYTALAFNWLRASGYTIPSTVETKLHTYLGRLLREDAVPDFYSRGMSSTVRAVALAALAAHGKVSRADLDRYAPYLEYMTLFGKAHFLEAALATPGGTDLADRVGTMIMAHANQSGGKFIFSEEWDDSYSRILASPLRDNCAVLSALDQWAASDSGRDQVGDAGFKLVRTITQSRGKRDHWENTQENMFCTNALIDYSRRYEQERPAMTVRVTLDDEELGASRFDDFRDPPANFARPIGPKDPGRAATLAIERQGTGRLYYQAVMRYATTGEWAERINSGIDIRREYSVQREDKWQLLADPVRIRRGELVRVDLFLSLPTARNFVVVDDPVPGGLEPVNRDLATSSTVDADAGAFQAAGGSWWFHYSDWSSYALSRWSFYHKELRHNAARFYSDYLPAGNYHLSYTAQAIADGSFQIMPVHAEEMYDPDIYGKGLPARLMVEDEEE